jgi:hypothetical protein
MAQSTSEIAKDIVVALLGAAKIPSLNDADKAGEWISVVYRKVHAAVSQRKGR